MTRSAIDPLGSSTVRTFDARITGALMLLYGVLITLLRAASGEHTGKVLSGVLPLVVGTVLVLGSRRVRWWQLSVVSILVAAAVSTTAVDASSSGGGPGGVAVFVVLVLQFSALRSRREAWLQYGWMMALYGVTLAVKVDTAGALGSWVSEAAVLAILTLAGTWTRGRVDEMVGELRRQADHDPLTGLLNRDGLHRSTAYARRRRDFGEGPPTITVLLMDIDHFKVINDTYGHPAGDEVLVWLSGLLRGATHPPDQIARFGGEEFLVVLAEADLASAYDRAERLRQLIASAAAGLRHPVTVSIGVTTGPAPSGQNDLSELYARADEALYRAKAAGRNRVEVAAYVPAGPEGIDGATGAGGDLSGAADLGAAAAAAGTRADTADRRRRER